MWYSPRLCSLLFVMYTTLSVLCSVPFPSTTTFMHMTLGSSFLSTHSTSTEIFLTFKNALQSSYSSPKDWILAHRTQKTTCQNTQLFTSHLPLCSKSWLYLWRTSYLLWPNYISPQSLLLSHSSTSLYPALPWFVNCLYHSYLYSSLQTWLL